MPEKPALGVPGPPGPLTQRFAEREAAETAASPVVTVTLTRDQADALRRAANYALDMRAPLLGVKGTNTLYGAKGILQAALAGRI